MIHPHSFQPVPESLTSVRHSSNRGYDRFDDHASVEGTFDGKPDIVTVNAGSNDLTLISNFIGPDPVISTIAR